MNQTSKLPIKTQPAGSSGRGTSINRRNTNKQTTQRDDEDSRRTSATGSDASLRSSSSQGTSSEVKSLIDAIEKAAETLKSKLNDSEKRCAVAVKNLKKSFSKQGDGPREEVTKALTDLEALSKSFKDDNLAPLLASLRSRISKGTNERGLPSNYVPPNDLLVQGQRKRSDRQDTAENPTKNKEIEGLTNELKKIEKELVQRHEQLFPQEPALPPISLKNTPGKYPKATQPERTPASSENDKTPYTMLAEIKRLALSFATEAENMAPKAGTANLRGKIAMTAHDEIEGIMKKLKALETNLEGRHACLFPAEGSLLRAKHNVDKLTPGKKPNSNQEQKPANTESTPLEVLSNIERFAESALNEIEGVIKKLKALETNLEGRHACLFPAEGSSSSSENNEVPPGKKPNPKAGQKPPNTERTPLEVLSNVERFAVRLALQAENRVPGNVIEEEITKKLDELSKGLEERYTQLFPEEKPSTELSTETLKSSSQNMKSKLKSEINTPKTDGTSSKSVETPLTLLSNVQNISLRFAARAKQMLSIVSQRDEELNQVNILWELSFGEERPDSTSGRKSRVVDATSRLKKIVDELRRLDKLSKNVEMQCSLLYKDTKGSEMPADNFKSPIDQLEGTIKNLQACREETSDIRKGLDNLCIIVNVKVQDARLSEKCSQLAEELKRFINSETLVAALEKMYETIMQETYAKKRLPNAERQNSKESKNDPLETIKYIDRKVSERLQELRSELDKVEQEKTTLLNRLSKMAGANLTDNNPNIADLSDPNRPTKLAEMYSELYDNAWTDAYEELEKSGKDEKVHIDTLYSILAESYMVCKDISRQQLRDIVLALTEPKTQESPSKEKSSGDAKLTALQSKSVTELRKQSADVFVKTLQTFLKEKWKKEKTSSWFDKERIQSYTMQCIKLCWLMHVQTPPVHIDLKVKPGDKFDTNKFKQYMKSGKKVDFVVWPPLLLHEGGSLLSKGVAQGK